MNDENRENAEQEKNDENRENEQEKNDENRENEREKNDENRDKFAKFGGITRAEFERIKADFLAATTPELRKEIFGVLLNDEMREAFKRFAWNSNQRVHASSVVHDYFVYLIKGFDPQRFNRFNDLAHFVRYSRLLLGKMFSKRVKDESKIQLDEGTEPDESQGLWPEAIDFFAHIVAVLKEQFPEDEILIFVLHRFDELSFPKIAALLERERGKSLSEKQVSSRYRKVEKYFEKKVVNFYEQGGVYLEAAPDDALRDFVALASDASKDGENPALDALVGELKRRADKKNENKTNETDGDDDFAAGSLAKIKV